jgi:hypothetical protein
MNAEALEIIVVLVLITSAVLLVWRAAAKSRRQTSGEGPPHLAEAVSGKTREESIRGQESVRRKKSAR